MLNLNISPEIDSEDESMDNAEGPLENQEMANAEDPSENQEMDNAEGPSENQGTVNAEGQLENQETDNPDALDTMEQEPVVEVKSEKQTMDTAEEAIAIDNLELKYQDMDIEECRLELLNKYMRKDLWWESRLKELKLRVFKFTTKVKIMDDGVTCVACSTELLEDENAWSASCHHIFHPGCLMDLVKLNKHSLCPDCGHDMATPTPKKRKVRA